MKVSSLSFPRGKRATGDREPWFWKLGYKVCSPSLLLFYPHPWTLTTEHETTNQKIFYITATILATTGSREPPTDKFKSEDTTATSWSICPQNGSSRLVESPVSTASPEKFYQPCNSVTSYFINLAFQVTCIM